MILKRLKLISHNFINLDPKLPQRANNSEYSIDSYCKNFKSSKGDLLENSQQRPFGNCLYQTPIAKFSSNFLKNAKIKKHSEVKADDKSDINLNLTRQKAQNRSYNQINDVQQRNNTRRQNPIKFRRPITNYQQFLLSSPFHENDVQMKQMTQLLQKSINTPIISPQIKQKLLLCLTKLYLTRQQIFKSKHQITKLQFLAQIQQQRTKDKLVNGQQMKQIQKQTDKPSLYLPKFLNTYIAQYKQLNLIMQDLLSSILKFRKTYKQNTITQQIKCQNQLYLTQKYTIFLVQQFSLMQFYNYYLMRLLRVDMKRQTTSRILQQADSAQIIICSQIVHHFSKIDFEFTRNTMPYDIQKYVQVFYENKLLQMLKFMHYEHSKNNKYEQFCSQLNLLVNLQKILKPTHLTYAKHKFYANFTAQNIFVVDRTTNLLLGEVQNVIKLFNLTVQSLYLDKCVIQKFESYLITIASTNQPQKYLSSQIESTLFAIYSKIGSIPRNLYELYLSSHCCETFDVSEYNLVQNIKFFIYSGCEDKLFLQSIFHKLQEMTKNRSLSQLNRKSKHMLHFLMHFICIKNPKIAFSEVTKHFISMCQPQSNKNQEVLRQIMRSSKNSPKSIKGFSSPCILKQSKPIIKNYKSALSTLQQTIFKQNLEAVILQMNSSSKQKNFFQIKQNFSFCSFELDFIVLKWQDQTKTHLLGYLDVQCVGLQYSYDTNEGQNQTETKQKIQMLSLVDYQKNLVFISKKVIRQQILKHYGWKVLYVPNKFLYEKNISRLKLKEKLKQAILYKFMH